MDECLIKQNENRISVWRLVWPPLNQFRNLRTNRATTSKLTQYAVGRVARRTKISVIHHWIVGPWLFRTSPRFRINQFQAFGRFGRSDDIILILMIIYICLFGQFAKPFGELFLSRFWPFATSNNRRLNEWECDVSVCSIFGQIFLSFCFSNSIFCISVQYVSAGSINMI